MKSSVLGPFLDKTLSAHPDLLDKYKAAPPGRQGSAIGTAKCVPALQSGELRIPYRTNGLSRVIE